MKGTFLIPILFAATGALVINLDESPRSQMSKQISKSKDRASTSKRLAEIGKIYPKDFEAFRTKQIFQSAIVGSATFILIIVLSFAPILALILTLLTSTMCFSFIDWDLSKRVKRQRMMIDAEFPAVIEMYSLALSAGESPLIAMERIAKSAKGSLATEFSVVVAQVKNGKAFHLALDEMGRGLDSVIIRRFIDSIVIATLRGAPLTDVLQRHAQEAREAQRNRVMAAAAKAEISMMVPIVFLILPVSILFALWPSLANLNLIAGA